MEFKYSEVVEPSTYYTEGLCEGIDVRKSKFTTLEDRGAIRAHEDWNKHIGPCGEYRGTLGPRFSFISVAVPECIPERLEVISYANEFAFLHDDVTDHVGHDTGEVENDEMMTVFLEAAHTGAIDTSNKVDIRRAGKKRIQSQLFLEMLAIDPECAKTTMKSWARFVEVGSSRQHETRFVELAKYIPYRIMDVGEMFWFGLVTFGLGLHIPDHELELCRELMANAWIAVGLQNDIWSWPKERDAATLHGKDHVVNAIWVLMQEHQTDVDGAMQICRKLIVEYVAKYLEVIEATKNDESISLDLRKYLDAMLYSISGNVVWSLECPRYNPDVSFNKTQLEWMRQGLPSLESCPVLARSPEIDSDESAVSPTADESDSTEDSLGSGSRQDSSLSTGLSLSPVHSNEGKDLQRVDTDHIFFEKAVLEAPYDYIASMPSKGVRDQFIDALNDWLRVPDVKVGKIKDAVRVLHNSSLLLDDFQDNSPLRRGKPSTHNIFGSAQTVNTATYSIIKAIGQIMEFSAGESVQEVMNSIMILFQGQAMDLFWTYNGHVPSEEEYYRMIDQKTGQLFSIATSLLLNAADNEIPRTKIQSCLHRLTRLLGRCFQIRDDYQNLVSADYTKQKGFCEDLDEGKWSLALIHMIHKQRSHMALLNVLSTGRKHGGMTLEQKQFVLDIIEEEKSLDYTRSVMMDLHVQLRAEIGRIEILLDSPNPAMRLLLELLRV
uniref:Fusicoccadiene synthase n=2 Tax=Phomopsis amygdali TaxID=1214568 RepID=FC1_PHOAM|nr:RecName: Full=Fusicoccadiene synthase; Short=FS; AltName: Full=Fusicoccin A biosynthetic gene clusters protein 1; AltName: Full=PaDC4:GGS; Includes: RecName: Full=Fusicocca-2,10(14)-diene synthase; AltName: Full=Diterpene cyclase 4; Short=DC 4; Includes: RecName: Full=Geranylgeranyl diphosphate synthase; Short=GGDP synthase; Short=GGS [Diaporthe amygdali]BAF45924.1 fusicoccadiene synthase [Diaporthe amygdali]BAF45925.1 fusicoccadiene synthase [Diaporthe amygdali]